MVDKSQNLNMIYSGEMRMATGIPMTTPSHDPATVRANLVSLQTNYPGQIFMLEGSGSNDREVVVSWLPIWFVSPALSFMLTQTLYSDSGPTPWFSWPEP